jgi:hypothetical protein
MNWKFLKKWQGSKEEFSQRSYSLSDTSTTCRPVFTASRENQFKVWDHKLPSVSYLSGDLAGRQGHTRRVIGRGRGLCSLPLHVLRIG